MLRVIRKDLILGRKILIVNLSMFAIFLTFVATVPEDFPPGLFAGMASFMLAFLPMGLVIREDKFDAMALQCSLPVSRRKVVKARFLFSEGLAILGVLAALLLGGMFPYSQFSLGDLFTPTVLLTGFTLVTLVLSFILPFSLRFGAKGLMVFLVAAQVLGVVLLTILMVAQSSVDKRVVEGIMGFFLRSRAFLGSTGFTLVLLVFLVTLFGLSYRVSCQVFENRDL